MTRLRCNEFNTFAVKVVNRGKCMYAGYSPDPDMYPEVMHRQVVTHGESLQRCVQHRDKLDYFIKLKRVIMQFYRAPKLNQSIPDKGRLALCYPSTYVCMRMA